MRFQLALVFVLAVGAKTFAQTTEEANPTPAPSSTTTANPGLPYGSACNGLIAQCNRYSNTVGCMSRRADPTTTAGPETTQGSDGGAGNPLLSLFLGGKPAPNDVCSVGAGTIVGRCQCQRNCKDGVYVDDGEFDEEREICVGLVGSRCTLLVPNCTKNGRCNLLGSVCVCEDGYVAVDRRCVPADQA